MTIGELLLAIDVLREPAVRLHYFWQRAECEAKADYLGDEEDLLVYYLRDREQIT